MGSAAFFDEIIRLTGCTHRLTGIIELDPVGHRFIHDPGGEAQFFIPVRYLENIPVTEVADWVNRVHKYQEEATK